MAGAFNEGVGSLADNTVINRRVPSLNTRHRVFDYLECSEVFMLCIFMSKQ